MEETKTLDKEPEAFVEDKQLELLLKDLEEGDYSCITTDILMDIKDYVMKKGLEAKYTKVLEEAEAAIPKKKTKKKSVKGKKTQKWYAYIYNKMMLCICLTITITMRNNNYTITIIVYTERKEGEEKRENTNDLKHTGKNAQKKHCFLLDCKAMESTLVPINLVIFTFLYCLTMQE